MNKTNHYSPGVLSPISCFLLAGTKSKCGQSDIIKRLFEKQLKEQQEHDHIVPMPKRRSLIRYKTNRNILKSPTDNFLSPGTRKLQKFKSKTTKPIITNKKPSTISQNQQQTITITTKSILSKKTPNKKTIGLKRNRNKTPLGNVDLNMI